MSAKQKDYLYYDEKAEQNDMYALIDNMSHEDRASAMATATEAARRRNMTLDEWAAAEEATANQLVRVAAAEAEEDPTMKKYVRMSAKEARALKAAETRRAAMAREVMERRAEVEAASRRAARDAMARAVRAADRTGADVVVGELPATVEKQLRGLPSGSKWLTPKLEDKPGDTGSSSNRVGMGKKLYKTRNKKSRRGRQGKRTRRARIARRTRRARK
jgi:poly-D-alanine transfer protein DltD